MKTTKLILGIVSIVLALIVLFQSLAASLGDAIEGAGGTSGGSGILVALCLLVAGIVAIAARGSRGGAICCTVLFALAGLFGVTANGIFKDLVVWGVLSLLFAAFFLVSAIVFRKPAPAKLE